MEMISNSLFRFRVILSVTSALFACAFWQVYQLARTKAWMFESVEWKLGRWVGAFALLTLIALMASTFAGRPRRYWQAVVDMQFNEKKWRRLATTLFVLLLPAFTLFVKIPFGSGSRLFFVRLASFWVISLAIGAALKGIGIGSGAAKRLICAWLLMGSLHLVLINLMRISNYPFATDWLEGNDIYYANLLINGGFFGPDRPYLALHPSARIIQGVPFLFAAAPPLWVFRLWETAMTLGWPAATALCIVRRIWPTPSPKFFWTGLWVFLFIFLGPVRHDVLISVVIILWGFDRRQFWRSALVVAVASAWAGISRVNWIPVPALIAVDLYAIQAPFDRQSGVWAYCREPLFWGLTGVASGTLAVVSYLRLGDGDPLAALTILRSPLLWHRLLPNPTFSVGILLGIVGVSAPLLLGIFFQLRRGGVAYPPVRALLVVVPPLILLLGGIVASLKIGGGSDLHNLDAYLILLLIASVSILFGRFTGEDKGRAEVPPIPVAVLILIGFLPVLFVVDKGGPLRFRDADASRRALDLLQQRVDEVAVSGGEVLFISQRHLVPLGLIHGVAPEEDYERKEISEMLYSEDWDYIAGLERDLSNKRFDLIIDKAHSQDLHGAQRAFGEEDDLWVEYVSVPLLRNYTQNSLLDEINLVMFMPKR